MASTVMRGYCVLALLLGAIIFASSLLHGEEQPGPEAGQESHMLPLQSLRSASEMEQYYLGRQYKYAAFPGRLVCLRCDTMPTPENVEVCKKEGHRHALAMEGDTMVHPLIFASEDLFTRVNAHDWYRKKVRVWGRYYADTDYLVVGDIQAIDEE